MNELIILCLLSRRVGIRRRVDFCGKWSIEPSSEGMHNHVVIAPLNRIELFPSIECEKRWTQNRELCWPQLCCVCGRASEASVDYRGTLPIFSSASRLVRNVPHCREHAEMAKGNALVHIDLWTSKKGLLAFKIYALSGDFIRGLLHNMEASPMLPPWDAFDWMEESDARFNQGIEQEFVSVWSKMLLSWSASERVAYLDAVKAPILWRDWTEEGLTAGK